MFSNPLVWPAGIRQPGEMPKTDIGGQNFPERGGTQASDSCRPQTAAATLKGLNLESQTIVASGMLLSSVNALANNGHVAMYEEGACA